MNSDTAYEEIDDLVSRVATGCMLAVPPDYSGVAMAATRALVRGGVAELHLVACPSSGLQTDLLIGAGCVATIEAYHFHSEAAEVARLLGPPISYSDNPPGSLKPSQNIARLCL